MPTSFEADRAAVPRADTGAPRAAVSPAAVPPERAGTVIVGMSGGVDSAVAALLLQREGRDVQGLFMSNWDAEDDAYCTAAEDFQDARRVCDTLGVPLHRASFAEQYRERVFAHFLDEYAAGRTPNPDVLCNREIKFGIAFEYMQRLGASWMATGHYARLHRTAGRVQLLKAVDGAKDQSYFLHSVAGPALARTLFPVGSMSKAQVRACARAAGLPVFDKPDSTGICFIGERPFQEFIKGYLRAAPGPIESADGRTLGAHEGLFLYTLGQRSGLGIGGRAGAAAAPWYVAAKDVARNALIVVQQPDHPRLLSQCFELDAVHWLNGDDLPAGSFDCAVETRYRQQDLPCTVQPLDAGGVRVRPFAPVRAVTPGQSAVFYRGEECLGGGVITDVLAYNHSFSAEAS